MYCRGADRRNPKLRRPDQIVCYQGKINLSTFFLLGHLFD